MEIIRSRQNELIKRFTALASDGKARQEAGEYVCAGQKLLGEAVSSGAEVTCVLTETPMEGLPCRLVTPALLQAVSPLKNSPGPVFTVRMRDIPPAETLRRVIVLENVQDPGNVGTLVRTAEAMGFAGTVIIKGTADPWQPKAVRAAAGSLLRLPILLLDSAEQALKLLSGAGYRAYTAAMDAELACWDADLGKKAAVVIGNEGAGAAPELKAAATLLAIPMAGKTESLNAAVAGSIIMYESMHQRKDNK